MQSLAYNFWNNKKGQILSFRDYTASYDPPHLNNAQIFKNHFDNLITDTNFIYENIIPLLKFNGVSFFFIYHHHRFLHGIFIVFDNGSLPESEQAELEQAELEQQELSTSVSKKRARSDQGRSDVYQGRLQIKRSRSAAASNSIIPESKAFFFQNSTYKYPFQSPSFLQKILHSISSTNIILIDYNSISSLQSFTNTLKQSAMHSPFFIPLVPQSTSVFPTDIFTMINYYKKYQIKLQEEPEFTTRYFIYTRFFEERFGNLVQNLIKTDFVDFDISRNFNKTKYEIKIESTFKDDDTTYKIMNKIDYLTNINTKIFDDNVRYIYAFISIYYPDKSGHSFSILIDKFNKTFCTNDSKKRTDTIKILQLLSTLSVGLTNLLINYSCLDFITELEKYLSGPVIYFQDYADLIEETIQSNFENIIKYIEMCKDYLNYYFSTREQLFIHNENLPLDRKRDFSLVLNEYFTHFVKMFKKKETDFINSSSISTYTAFLNTSSITTYTANKLTKITDKFISVLNQINIDVIKKISLLNQKGSEDFQEFLQLIKSDKQLVDKICLDLLSKYQKKLLLIQDNVLDGYCVLWTFILLFYMFKFYELNLDAFKYIGENIKILGIGFIIDIFKIFLKLSNDITEIINNGLKNNIDIVNIDIIKIDIVNAIRHHFTLTNYNDSHANTSIFGSDYALLT